MPETTEAPAAAPRITKPAEREPEPPKARKSPLGLIIILLVLAAAITGAVLWWIHSGTYEDTDDAQVNVHLSAISSRVAGTGTAVYVEENQFGKAGQLIAELDPRDFHDA